MCACRIFDKLFASTSVRLKRKSYRFDCCCQQVHLKANKQVLTFRTKSYCSLVQKTQNADGTDFRISSTVLLCQVSSKMDYEKHHSESANALQNMRHAGLSNWWKHSIFLPRSTIQINITFADKVTCNWKF